jgi:hypothetical protein
LVFAALGIVSGRYLILREDGFEGALRDTGTTIDAGVWVYVIPGPLLLGFTGDNAFYRADVYAARVTQAETGDDVSHIRFLLVSLALLHKPG